MLDSMIPQLLCSASATIKSRHALVLENIALRQQLHVFRRSSKVLRLTWMDRSFWILLSRLWTGWRGALVIVKPETVINWHRKGFRPSWRWKSRKPGRPRVPKETRDLIRRMSSENPMWGAPRIHGELLKLGIEVSEPTVAKYVTRFCRLPSQTWNTFLRNHMRDTVSIDFFTVPTATFRILYVLVVLSHDRRQIVHFNVTDSPTALWTGRQLTQAFPWDSAPKYLVRDNDGIYGLEFRRAVKNLGTKEIKIAAKSPWQNPYVERVIGSIRRECLDHMIIFNENHLRWVLRRYFRYYSESRTHLGIGEDCPVHRYVQPPEMGEIVSIPEVGGLHHQYSRVAA